MHQAKSHQAVARAGWAAMPVVFLLSLAGCSTVGEAPKADASMGLLIAHDKCGTCHQTGGSGESPNARAPTFGEIVNRPGMTADTLTAILRDSHNYPVEMGFRLQPHQVDSLVAYMIRWREDGAPPQS